LWVKYTGKLAWWLCCLPFWLIAQTPSAKIVFPADTLSIGRPTWVTLTVTHPANSQLLLPGGPTQFPGWELLAQTEPQAASSAEGVVTKVQYQISTFQVSSKQKLSVRVGVVLQDTTWLTTDTAIVTLNERIREVTPELTYQEFTGVLPIHTPINWMLLGVLGMVLLVAGALGYVLLQKPVRKWLALRRLQRQYSEQLLTLEQHFLAWQQKPSRDSLNLLNQHWKHFLSQGLGQQLAAFTVPEWVQWLEQEPALADKQFAASLLQLAQWEESLNFEPPRSHNLARPMPNHFSDLQQAYQFTFARLQLQLKALFTIK
jgi:hypothetical protein